MTERPVVGLPTANPVVVLREEFDDWAVLFNPDTAAAIGVNPVGVEIWKALDGRTPLSAVAAILRERFVEVPSSVEDDVAEFVADLLARGFLGQVGDSGTG